MDIYDPNYMNARHEQMYGVSSAIIPPSHSLIPSTVRHDPLLSQSQAASEYKSGVWLAQSTYLAAPSQMAALNVGVSPTWAAQAAQPSRATSPALQVNNTGVWESPYKATANLAKSESLFASHSGYSAYATPPASQIAITEVASPSWMAPKTLTTLATPQGLQVNKYGAGVVVESPYATVNVAKADSFFAPQSGYSAFATKALSQQAAEWSPNTLPTNGLFLADSKPPLVSVGPTSAYGLYDTQVVSDAWRSLVDNVKEVLAVFIGEARRILGDHLGAILEAQRISAKLVLQERVKRKVKALHKPFHIIPQSLHPSDSIA